MIDGCLAYVALIFVSFTQEAEGSCIGSGYRRGYSTSYYQSRSKQTLVSHTLRQQTRFYVAKRSFTSVEVTVYLAGNAVVSDKDYQKQQDYTSVSEYSHNQDFCYLRLCILVAFALIIYRFLSDEKSENMN